MSSRIVTLPNLLTIFRMVLIPVFVSLLFYQRFVLALGAFVVAGVTDGLDGLLARRFQQQSPLGRILDPIADKMMRFADCPAKASARAVLGHDHCDQPGRFHHRRRGRHQYGHRIPVLSSFFSGKGEHGGPDSHDRRCNFRRPDSRRHRLLPANSLHFGGWPRTAFRHSLCVLCLWIDGK